MASIYTASKVIHEEAEILPLFERKKKRLKSSKKKCRKFCSKKRFSREEAKDVVRTAKFARKLAIQTGDETCRQEVRTYQCTTCPGAPWHVTSKPMRLDLASAC